MTEKIILNSSDDAAKFVEGISGWVDSRGFFFGKDERSARYSGCTHTACEECGEPAPKAYIKCDKCREKKAIEIYAKRETTEWYEDRPVWSGYVDKYFNSSDEIHDHCGEHGIEPSALRLVLCEPVFLSKINDDFWADDLPEDSDGELPEEIFKAVQELNELLEKHGPVSWVPGKLAVVVE